MWPHQGPPPLCVCARAKHTDSDTGKIIRTQGGRCHGQALRLLLSHAKRYIQRASESDALPAPAVLAPRDWETSPANILLTFGRQKLSLSRCLHTHTASTSGRKGVAGWQGCGAGLQTRTHDICGGTKRTVSTPAHQVRSVRANRTSVVLRLRRPSSIVADCQPAWFSTSLF